jgi:hypothetical protein
MAIRVELSNNNMDMVMHLVREFDKRPYEIINMLLDEPKLIEDARSKLYDDEKTTKHKEGEETF